MTFKRHISLIILALCTALAAQAQLVFEPTEWDFGTISENGGSVTHTFTGTNRGDKPLVIVDVVTTCGCTVPAFSRQPVKPGGKTQITVTFDPANRPGRFHKELSVYSSERRKVATLAISGNVTPRKKSMEEIYPVAAGSVRLTTSICAFSYIYIGQQVQTAIGYANTSGRTIFLELRSQESSGVLTTHYQQQIAPGEEGEIGLRYLIPANKPRYGTVKDLLEVCIDGRPTGTLLMVHGIGIDPRPEGETQAARAEMSENMLKFGAVKHAAPAQQRTFVLRNAGTGELIVRAVESKGRIGTTLSAGLKIPAGGAFTATVTLDPGKQEFGVLSEHLIVVTNDPARPMLRMRVTAIIEQ